MHRSANNLLIVRGGALLGGILALFRVWAFTLTQNSLMDEGEYLLKGLFFVTGVYRPFQDYGVWTNQMPLAFLIPGWVQQVFGVGIQTGRGYALALNALILLGVWFLARRLARLAGQGKMPGEWFAVGAVWMYALNTASLKMYSTTTSQVLITAMLVGIFLLILGENRPQWQVTLGGLLSGLMVLTRLNLAPALPFMAGYIFWQHGKRAGVWAVGGMGLTLLIGHALFWPGILRAWAAWIPLEWLAPWRPPEGQPFWNPMGDLDSRVLSFWFAIRFHFMAMIGVLGTTIWVWGWKEAKTRRIAFFLGSLFLVLLAAHAWATLGSHEQADSALGNDYCIFCFPVYTSFFSMIGILLAVLWGASQPWRGSRFQNLLVAVGILLLTGGVGYGAYKDIGETIARWRIPRIRTLLSRGESAPGIPLWDFLDTRFHLSFELTKRLLPTLAGLCAGIAILLAAFWLQKWLAKQKGERVSTGGVALGLLLVIGMILSPTVVLGAGYTNYDCSPNVIAAYEAAGKHLAESIPAHARVYWQGSLSSVPLLYLDQPQLLPGQINLDYTLRLSGDDDEHLRFGFWTETLAQDWLAQADFAIVAERYYKDWLREALEDPNRFVELTPTQPLAPCDERSILRVFQKVP
ncbi:MAG: hypothetical protein Fur0022_15180 [Anaerolineales bacterium]